MSVTGDPRRDTTGDRARGAKEGLCRRLVPLLTEQDIHQVPLAINGAVEVDQTPFHFEVSFVDVPAAANSASPVLAQCLAQQWGELRFPFSYRFVGKDQTPLYRENTPRYGVRVSHSLREWLKDAVHPAIAKLL